ncbi:hypothetical protein [Legionella shakespearei]|nr:hypothetical protein [Legionella shakespearei]
MILLLLQFLDAKATKAVLVVMDAKDAMVVKVAAAALVALAVVINNQSMLSLA